MQVQALLCNATVAESTVTMGRFSLVASFLASERIVRNDSVIIEAAETFYLIFSKRQPKFVSTIGAHIESTNTIFKTFNKYSSRDTSNLLLVKYIWVFFAKVHFHC